MTDANDMHRRTRGSSKKSTTIFIIRGKSGNFDKKIILKSHRNPEGKIVKEKTSMRKNAKLQQKWKRPKKVYVQKIEKLQVCIFGPVSTSHSLHRSDGKILHEFLGHFVMNGTP